MSAQVPRAEGIYILVCSPDVAKLFLDLPDGLEIGRAVKRVPAHEQKLDQVPRDVAPGDIEPPREVRERKAVVHRHDVRHAVARVDHDARRQTCPRVYSAPHNQLIQQTGSSHTPHPESPSDGKRKE